MGLPVLLMIVFVMTRWPGLMPPSFSAAYGLLFCAGVYFRGRLAWWLPLVAMAVADCLINYFIYWKQSQIPFQWYQLANYPLYLGLLALGRCFKGSDSAVRLLGAGVLGGLLFYLLTNTLSWFLNPFGNPEYTRTLEGWWMALTQGTAGHPPSWEFLRNTLLSSGLFTGLFVGAMKAVDQMESAAEKDAANTPVPQEDRPLADDAQPEETPA